MLTNLLKRSGVVLVAAALALAGCKGDTGPAGANGADGTNGTNGSNGTNGTNGTDGNNGVNGVAGKLSLTIDGVVTAPVNGTNTATITFTIRPAAAVCPGAVCDDGLSALGQKTFYATSYDPATNTFPTKNATGALSFSFTGFKFKGFTADGNGAQYTATRANPGFAPETSASAFVYGYISNKAAVPAPTTGHYMLPSMVSSAAKLYGTVAYTSNANVSGCENCHNAPYSKHGYRQARVAGLNDMVSCKACHTDQRAGTDGGWFMIADDPANYTKGFDDKGEFTVEPYFSKYAYTANLMNDTHNSHAFEFNYPQSISNCVTCHAGKLQNILTDANFKPTVCKSCHPVTGPVPADPTGGVEAGRAPALLSIFASKGVTGLHANIDLYAATAGGVDVNPAACNLCHKAGGIGKTFAQIHAGFNEAIYSAEGVRFADSIKVTVGATAFDPGTNLLTVPFTIAGTAANALVKPTVVVSLYGYGSKDFVVSGHGSAADGMRNLEYTDGATNNSARLVLDPAATTAGVTQWTATADLTTWASMITAGTVKRVQVAVLPAIGLDQTKAIGATNPAIAVTGATAAIELATGAVNPAPPGVAIVDTAKCNKCHDALATTFHGPNYGSAGVVGCRTCHWVGAGGSHLEMQSRSIDSYVHAIHQMQYFDIQNVDLTDPVAALRYGDHIEGNYPNFAGTLNCESCHTTPTKDSPAITYEVPDQTKSLPGILSASRAFKGGTRAIGGNVTGAIPAQISGPAERACGGCHRAQLINEDNASSLAAFYAHTTMAGTSVTDTSAASLTNVTTFLMNQVGVVPGTIAPVAGAEVEGCVICHPRAGSEHQALFNTWLNGLK